MLYDKIKLLAKKKKIPICRIENELNIASGSLCKWNENSPSFDKVLRVAKILEVSVEELVEMKI